MAHIDDLRKKEIELQIPHLRNSQFARTEHKFNSSQDFKEVISNLKGPFLGKERRGDCRGKLMKPNNDFTAPWSLSS